MKRALCVFLAAAALLALAACAPAQKAHTPGPAITPDPEINVMADQTHRPTPSPTPRPTPSPTPVLDSSAVVFADGFYHIALDGALKARITGVSYPPQGEDCAVSYDDLRCIRLLHYDFSGVVRRGELIVHAKLADEVLEIFHELFLAKYPIWSMRLIDDFDADDDLSMEANNTSAFNYRLGTGSSKLSLHSFGAAIDINPLFNPYIRDGRISPEGGARYADRSRDFPGKIGRGDLCYELFTARGWSWGGDWRTLKDYHHFFKDLGF